MKCKDKLIYDLIYSKNDEYTINIGKYIPNIYNYEVFISELKSILKKSKVKILKYDVEITSKTVFLHLKTEK